MSLYRFALLWLVGTNLLAIVLTVSDKVRAKKGKWRVPEDTLLFVALLGGAVGERSKRSFMAVVHTISATRPGIKNS